MPTNILCSIYCSNGAACPDSSNKQAMRLQAEMEEHSENGSNLNPKQPDKSSISQQLRNKATEPCYHNVQSLKFFLAQQRKKIIKSTESRLAF